MPKAKSTSKQKQRAAKPAKTKTATKQRRHAPAKRAKAVVHARRAQHTKLVAKITQASPPSPAAPHRKTQVLGLSLLSLVLILLGALVNCGVVLAANADVRRANTEAQTSLQIVQPREYLYQQAAAHKLNAKLLDHIIYCESRWRMVPNATSTAYGYFQILDGTERATPQFAAGERKFDPLANIDMGIYLFGRYGAAPWFESMPCWGWRR